MVDYLKINMKNLSGFYNLHNIINNQTKNCPSHNNRYRYMSTFNIIYTNPVQKSRITYKGLYSKPQYYPGYIGNGRNTVPYDVTPVITWIDWNNFRSSFWATLWLNRYPHAFILSIFHGANSSLADPYHSDPDLKNFLTDPDPGKKRFCTYQEIIKKIAKIAHFPSIMFFGITFL